MRDNDIVAKLVVILLMNIFFWEYVRLDKLHLLVIGRGPDTLRSLVRGGRLTYADGTERNVVQNGSRP